MSNLEKRISALEVVNKSPDELTIIRRFVRPGHLDAEINRLRGDDGKLWTRQTGETEQELIDRASLAATRSPLGIARLTMANVEVAPC